VPYTAPIHPTHAYKALEDPEQSVVVLETNAEPGSFPGLKREYSNEFLKPFSERDTRIPPSPQNLKLRREALKRQKVLRRYKDHPFKTRKPVPADEKVIYTSDEALVESGILKFKDKVKGGQKGGAQSTAAKGAAPAKPQAPPAAGGKGGDAKKPPAAAAAPKKK
jgi:hypothetical protein